MSAEDGEDVGRRDDSGGADYLVKRKVLDQLRLEEVAEKHTWSTKATLVEQLRESLR